MAACVASAANAAPPPYWKESGHAYDARKTPLRKVLQDFADSNNVTLRMSGTFAAPVNGRIQGATLIEFLDRLAVQQRFQWFTYGNTLYVSPLSDSVEERLEVGEDAIESVKPALIGLGLFESKFGWGELPEDGVITLKGPREYVTLVRQTIRPQKKKDEPEPMIFRLRHAAVDDRTITVRDQTVVTPGVASLLKNILAAREGKPATRTLLSELKPNDLPIPPPTPLTAGGGVSSSTGAGLGSLASRTSAPLGSGRPSPNGIPVEGDIRTNSIVIYDVPAKRAFYQRLIDALDTPQRLVEIEAYIIDINRERMSDLGFDMGARRLDRSDAIAAAAALGRSSPSGTMLVLQGLQRFFARVRALEAEGDAQLLAKPSISTLENLVAVLDLSQTVYIKSTGERVANVTPVTTGTLLRVTPRVVEIGSELQVHLTVDIEDGKVANPASGNMPEVLRSNISTQAMLQNEESLVIGGYNVDSSVNRTQGVPGLRKMPGFGGFFSGTHAEAQSRQRLFIITPRVVPSPSERLRAGQEARQRNEDAVSQTRVQRDLGLQWVEGEPARPAGQVRVHAD
ncbi:MAG TPA: type III secretion system outer membrane ring subunit SctC [Albitalea sp.]|uniref:type III secretion system outer membrane ring subunit SctC n=1 Tax=Piscinibacter sp. TaxID=1903157 RepID=UPI002ED09932